jgi:peptide/nickel transport system substrate-binding protein
MQVRRRVRTLAFAGVAIAMLLAACSSTHSTTAAGARIKGGTATYAIVPPGNDFSYIFPLLNFADATGANLEYSEYLMWRPLYWFGAPTTGPSSVGLDETYSLALPPTITHPTPTTTVTTITLKHWLWSNGTPVTSRDVEFWYDLMRLGGGKNIWWDYVTGQFPDNVTSFKIISPTTFSMTWDARYAAPWIYNELAQLFPIPQASWDKESATGKIGNYDLTSSGAHKVLGFLLAQNKDLSTYATNPLWKVVDGPFTLTQFTASTGDATYVRNPRYSGLFTGSIHAIRVLSFTSDDAEFDTLLSSSGITYGYVPYNDAAEIGRVKADGYKVQSWNTWGITFITLNFASPQAGPIFKQLYLRQALQHLINQTGYLKSFMGGYGYPTYGPVPLEPISTFVSPQQKRNPYPYDPAAATKLLESHGWKVVTNGTDTCARPGTAADECGAGITAGEKLAFTLQYSTGVQAVDEEVAAFQSSLASAGITLTLSGGPFDTVVGDDVPCSKTGCWQMNYYGGGWIFDPGYADPDGTALFKTGAIDNVSGYSNAHADALMDNIPSGGLNALYAYENYIAQQVPMLWLPEFNNQISAVSDKLGGAFPQDPLDNIYPERWYFVK